MAKTNFTTQIYDYFRVDSGSKSTNNDLGKRYYTITCGNGDGFGYYENGVHKIRASNFSIETVGEINEKNPGDDTFSPAKIIQAINGDIYIHAMAGDLILQGNNVYIRADGDSNIEGKVEINANNNIDIEGKDVTVLGTSNARLASYGDVVVGGKLGTNINGALTSMSDNSSMLSDFGAFIAGDIFSPSQFLETFSKMLDSKVF